MPRVLPRRAGSFTFAALLGALLLVAGCSTPYVNIPHQSGDIAGNDPNADNVRTIEAMAIRAVLAESDIPRPVSIKLPPGTDELTYAAVANQAGEDVLTPADTQPAPAATLTVEQVRIRGWDAEVDVLRPSTGTVRRLVTVSLKYEPFSGWSARSTRTWRGPADASLPTAETGSAPGESP